MKSSQIVLVPSLLLLVCGLALSQGPGGGPPPVPPLPSAPPTPLANPTTPARAILGKILFWDEQLSSDDTVACGTCHLPEAGGGDPRLGIDPRGDGLVGTADDAFGSPGVRRSDPLARFAPDPVFGFERQVTTRAAPSAINAGFFNQLFWDGRAGGTFIDPDTNQIAIFAGGALENQASGPPVSGVEMAHDARTWADVTAKLPGLKPLDLATDLTPDIQAALALAPDYPALFAAAFGDPAITQRRVVFALAAYQRTLVSDQTPWDAFNAGNTTALTPLQQQGLQVFNGPGNCTACHGGALFSDGVFHNLGLRSFADDPGRAGAVANPGPLAQGAFKTPSLRNVGLRPRFMHTGELQTLQDVVDFYDVGGGTANPTPAPALVPLGLSPLQKAALVAFLTDGLTDPRVAQALPPFDRPTLHGETRQEGDALFGAAHPGSGGLAPLMLADVPAHTGHAAYKIGVGGAAAPGQAVLAVSAAPAPAGANLGGIPLNLATSQLLVLHEVSLEGAGPQDGVATVPFPLPEDPTLVGVALFAQWFVVDPLAVGGAAATRGAAITIF